MTRTSNSHALTHDPAAPASRSTQVMGTVGGEYLAAGSSRGHAMTDVLPRMGHTGTRLVDAAVIAMVVAVVAYFATEAIGRFVPGADVLLGLAVGGVWYLARPHLNRRV